MLGKLANAVFFEKSVVDERTTLLFCNMLTRMGLELYFKLPKLIFPMFKEKLCQIGLTDSEGAIYIELLKLGPQAVSVIAKRSRMNRTTTYSILKSLQAKGLVSSFKRENMKIFSANDPNSLVGYMDRKCRLFDFHKSELLEVIPKLRGLFDQYEFKRPIVSYYDGLEGVKHVMYDCLNARGLYRGFMCIDRWLEAGLEDFLLEYKDFRIMDKKVPLRGIVPDTPEVRDFFRRNYDFSSDLTKILYVDATQFSKRFKSETNIYNDKVAFVNLDPGEEYGVVIQNQDIAEMQKLIFDMAWKGFEGFGGGIA